jgi:hypothetical protein
MVPMNIGIYGNHFRKPEEWRTEGWAVKNHFEIKTGRQIKFSYNVLENNWPSAQTGFAINLKVTTCDTADYPWAYTKLVTLSHNVSLNSTNGITVTGNDDARAACWSAGSGTIATAGSTILGVLTKFAALKAGWKIRAAGQTRTITAISSDTSMTVDSAFSPAIGAATSYQYNQPVAGQLSDLTVEENLFVSTTTALQVLRGTLWTTYSHNTFVHRGTVVVADAMPANTGFRLRSNLFTNELGNGIKGSGIGEGNATLAHYFPGSEVTGNLFGNEVNAALYPYGNFLAPTTAAMGMVDPANGHYALSPSSPYRGKAPDKRDPGADIELLHAVKSMVTLGEFNPLVVPRYP